MRHSKSDDSDDHDHDDDDDGDRRNYNCRATWRGTTSVDRCALMAFINYSHSL